MKMASPTYGLLDWRWSIVASGSSQITNESHVLLAVVGCIAYGDRMSVILAAAAAALLFSASAV